MKTRLTTYKGHTYTDDTKRLDTKKRTDRSRGVEGARTGGPSSNQKTGSS